MITQPSSETSEENDFQAAKKSQIYKKLILFNEKTVRKTMNEVISNSRKCSLKEAGDQRVLFGSEVREVLNLFK
jgi:hypothetical protein